MLLAKLVFSFSLGLASSSPTDCFCWRFSGNVNEASLLRAVRACYNIHLVSHSLVNKTTAKATLTQVLSYVFAQMEASDAALRKQITGNSMPAAEAGSESALVAVEVSSQGSSEVATEDLKEAAVGTDEGAAWPSVDHKNAWLLFRALCKLSMKDAPSNKALSAADNEDEDAEAEAAAAADPIAVQSKVLSLELLMSVLKASGPAFRSSPRFVQAIRTYLCVSLLRNCTANVPEVVDISLQVFVQLAEHFKDHLKVKCKLFVVSRACRVVRLRAV
jgi:brefeldin A-inhibited guanine nucleotide-exchange protein